MSGKAATANRLREGDIVYLTRKGEWSSDLQEAWVIEGDDSELVGWAEKAVKDRHVVDAYIIEVDSIKQYGSFEMYSDDGEYYAEGGLWFSKGVLYDYDGSNQSINSPDFTINLNQSVLTDIIFESNIIFDLESIENSNYFIFFMGDYSFSYVDELLSIDILDLILEGFVLIENNSINDGQDFYMNKYEITSKNFSNSQNQGEVPIELDCQQAKDYVGNLNLEYIIPELIDASNGHKEQIIMTGPVSEIEEINIKI